MVYLSLSLLSAAAVAYEVLLIRLFSIALWQHFAAAAISLALLGYGASGTFVALAQGVLLRRFRWSFSVGAALFGLAAPACFALSQAVPFNPMALGWDAGQWGRFAAMYVALAVPFFFAGTCLGLTFRHLGDRIPRLYCADLVGAGSGAVAVVGLLHILEPSACLRAVGMAGFAAAGLVWASRLPTDEARRTKVSALALILGTAASLSWPEGWIAPRMSEYKGLSEALRVPGARVVEERWSPLGGVALVESRQFPLRHAPGLSLTCPSEIPEQLGLFADGEFIGAVDRTAGAADYLDCLPAALPYRSLPRPRVAPKVAVLGAGAGAEILQALRNGAERVDAVELDPQVVALVRAAAKGFSASPYDRGGVRVHASDARAFIASTRERYDLILVAAFDGAGGALPGVQSTAAGYTYTAEGFASFLNHLTPGGLVAVTRGFEVPPRGSLKLLATGVAALESLGLPAAECAALVRTWSTTTLLLKGSPFREDEVEAVRRFCRERGFDLAYLPGMRPEEANRFNVLDEPHLYRGAMELLGPGRREFLRRYKFFVEAATDDRPYFSRFFKWRVLPELLGARVRGGGGLVEWGYLLAVATLLQALIAGVALILLPLGRLRSNSADSGRGDGLCRGVYFTALGLGFLFAEIAMIQRLTLLLGHPVYASSAVLAAFLVFAGLGSAASERLWAGVSRGRAAFRAALAVAALSLAYQALLPRLLPLLFPLPLAARAAVAAGLVAPLAFSMGMPFPLGLGAVAARAPQWVPWAWGLNGFASVWSAALAAILAIHVGYSGVVLAAAGSYLAAAWAARGAFTDPPRAPRRGGAPQGS